MAREGKLEPKFNYFQTKKDAKNSTIQKYKS
jgi:hypothetical protein